MTAVPSHRLRIRGATKSFGATRAVVHADLTIRPGTVHTLLGENGSGKSTLVKMLGGVHRPDSGEMTLDNDNAEFRNPRDARRAGIAAVFQEVLTVDAQSVYENVWLGTDGVFATKGRHSNRRKRAKDVLERLLGHDVRLDIPVSSLSLSDRQAICIARALVTDPKLLILDESTASLDIATRDRLFEMVRELSKNGTSTLFISHRMDEIMILSDEITVLRSGSTIDTLSRHEALPQRLVELMAGKSSAAHSKDADKQLGEVLLRTREFSLGDQKVPFDFELRAGELVGLAGLEGHGQDEFISRLAGIIGGAGTVEVATDGTFDLLTTRNSAKLGVAYLPRERRRESLFPAMTIKENFALPTIGRDQRLGLWSPARTTQRFTPFAKELNIRMANEDSPISTLSGGNQQKVLMARWIATEPTVLLLNDPTRGVDLGTKRELYAILEQLCERGMAIVMLSSEVDELVELMDRVLVFRDRNLERVIERKDLNRQKLVSAYYGQHEEVMA
ncbi:MAG: sugar ABC transporter ATP-binding protein [Gulosibacter sp.]|uniref:sugar ABC transporter ATP-binding protein n=1 Tax=Gulosibacter sp. TaxID=2817531 RepID=UPI003F933931